MSKGVVILAVGHAYYGKMAVALASTIKVCSPAIPITILCSPGAIEYLNNDECSLFDKIIIPKESYVIQGDVRYLRPKLLLYDLSPYTETLYIDADISWFNQPIEGIFNLCKDTDFCIKNYGFTNIKDTLEDKSAWASASDIRLVYKLKDELNYSISSEIIYFKKTKQTKKLFATALSIFDNPKVSFRLFAGYMADELALSISMMVNKIYPSIVDWQPIYWRQSNKEQCSYPILRDKFYGLSMGGVRATKQEIEIYNMLINKAYYTLSISHPHSWINKSQFILDRKQI